MVPTPFWNRKVVLSNQLTRWGHGLTLSEKRVIALGISKLNSKEVITSNGRGYKTKIYAEEYTEVYSVSASIAYRQMIAAAFTLPERRISGFKPAHRRNGSAIEVVPIRWIVEARHVRGEGTVELEWNPEIVPELVGLTREFTSYPVGVAGMLWTAAAWRIFELVSLFPKSGRASFDHEDFLVSLGVPSSGRKDFGAVRRRYLVPAVEQINSVLKMELEFTVERRGRKVSKIHFSFRTPLLSDSAIAALWKTCGKPVT